MRRTEHLQNLYQSAVAQVTASSQDWSDFLAFSAINSLKAGLISFGSLVINIYFYLQVKWHALSSYATPPPAFLRRLGTTLSE